MSQKSGPAEQKRHAPGAAELEPLSRRCLQAAGALSLLLLLVVVNSLLNSGSESPFNPNPVAAAAERTAEVPGMRIAMTMRAGSAASGQVTITGNGSYNGETELAEVVYRAATPEGRVEFDAILGEAWYLRYPRLVGRMPEGKEWIKLAGLPGQGEKEKVGVESPEEMLESIAAAGSVQRVGKVAVRKKQTIRYRAELSAEEAIEVLRAQGKTEIAEQLENGSVQLVGPLRVEAFIDRHGILRRVRTLSAARMDGQTITNDTSMDFFDFGIKPDIQVPDDSQVYDLTPLLQEQLDALGEAT